MDEAVTAVVVDTVGNVFVGGYDPTTDVNEWFVLKLGNAQFAKKWWFACTSGVTGGPAACDRKELRL